MALGYLQRKSQTWLLTGRTVREWHDTREIAQGVFSVEWASQDQIEQIRQSLNRLEARGTAERLGFFAE